MKQLKVYYTGTFLSSIHGKHRVCKFWQNRVRRDTLQQIRRVVSANLAEGEHYYLRVLLNHVAGATSFECPRTGKLLPTFHEAAERRGLIEEDNTLDESLAEATEWMMPYAL
jgi:hypothetical protein